MNHITTRGIILTRTDFGEADRILTLLTPDHGKLRLMARGVRRVKSKLAGGIELFSVSDIVFIHGKGEIGTLISSRLDRYYGRIVSNLDRTMLGYDLIKLLNRVTEDEPEAEYFSLLQEAFGALDDSEVSADVIQMWFSSQLLKLAGHTPNLITDDHGAKLTDGKKYNFNFEAMSFTPTDRGRFTPNHIKFLRLLFSSNDPQIISKVQGSHDLIAQAAPLIQTMLKTHIRI